MTFPISAEVRGFHILHSDEDEVVLKELNTESIWTQ